MNPLPRKSILSIVVAIGVVAAVMAPAYPAAAAPTCFGEKATIVGTNRDKTQPVGLKGTPGNDVIVGLRGYDHIDARGGDDLICAGGGDDEIYGGPGNDKIKGGDGIEVIAGRGGNDWIWAGPGPLAELYGEGGNDRLFGGPGSDDWLVGGPGDDVMNGGRGRDVVLFGDSPRGVHADLSTGEATGHGNDRMVSVEIVAGTPFDDVLSGDDKANLLAGGTGDDELHGRGGDDHLRSGDPAPAGNDLLDGGEGSDTANYYLSWEGVEADLSTGQAVSSGVDTLVGIENLFGSKENDVLIGNDENNVIQGFQGDDVMDGRGGTDMAMFQNSFELLIDLREGTAVEERGSDTLENFEDIVGSAFADTVSGDDGPNSVWGGPGADTLVGTGGDDSLIGGRGNDNVNGGDGTDACEGETRVDCELDPSTTATHSPQFSRSVAGLRKALLQATINHRRGELQ
jgi:Ca2+-binding RTX toxin-like protein